MIYCSQTKRFTRRDILKAAIFGAGSAAVARFTPSAWARPGGANGDVRIAVAGLNQKGARLARQVVELPGARLTALCDVDPRVLAREVDAMKALQVSVFASTDARDLMDRPDIDAVVIATSNHWHALLTIWACQAGKDVYVEKPVCHTAWEGRKMIDAAARYNRIVQSGTQARSDPGIAEAVQYVEAGHLGGIQWIHAMCYRLRPGIGRKLPWYPTWLDYDLYCGPAPMAPLERNELHYDWHWKWDTGDGDLANIGIHQFDIARWFAGNPPFPRRIASFGGRFVVDDAGEPPNTHFAIFDYPSFPIFLEIRGLPEQPGVQRMDTTRGVREGVIVQCENGYFAGWRGGAIYDNDGNRVKAIPGDGGANHMANFVSAVRSRRTSDLPASVETGWHSSAPCLIGNISYRAGHPASPGEIHRAIGGIETAERSLNEIQRHLAVHGVDLERTPLTLGPWLELDGAPDSIGAVAGHDPSTLELARHLLRGTCRPPYRIPDKV